MANSKVQLADGTVLVDLTADTVTPANLYSGATAHAADGSEIVGEYTPTTQALITTRNGNFVVPEGVDGYSSVEVNTPSGLYGKDPIHFDITTGYVNNTTWTLGGTTVSYSDVFEVLSGLTYFVSLGADVGTRFRALFTTTDTALATKNVTGTNLYNKNNPSKNEAFRFVAPGDGYLTVQKDNTGKAGVELYVYELYDGDHPIIAALSDKVITQNGIYLASADSVDGWFRVEVNVQ